MDSSDSNDSNASVPDTLASPRPKAKRAKRTRPLTASLSKAARRQMVFTKLCDVIDEAYRGLEHSATPVRLTLADKLAMQLRLDLLLKYDKTPSHARLLTALMPTHVPLCQRVVDYLMNECGWTLVEAVSQLTVPDALNAGSVAGILIARLGEGTIADPLVFWVHAALSIPGALRFATDNAVTCDYDAEAVAYVLRERDALVDTINLQRCALEVDLARWDSQEHPDETV